MRLGELLVWTWDQVDWEHGFVTLNAEETKAGYCRAIPIIDGDMRTWFLLWSRDHADGCPYVFHRAGEPAQGVPQTLEESLRSGRCSGSGFTTCAVPLSAICGALA